MKYVLLFTVGVAVGVLAGYTFGYGEGYKDCKDDLFNKVPRATHQITEPFLDRIKF